MQLANLSLKLFFILSMMAFAVKQGFADTEVTTSSKTLSPLRFVDSIGGSPIDIEIANNILLLLTARNLEFLDISDPAHPVFLSRMAMPGRADDMAVRGQT